MRVLIAEDDEMSRIFLKETVENWGYEVVLACDGDEAWEMLSQDAPPRVAILDWMMPGLSGVELCRRVAQRAEQYRPYVILLTSREGTEDAVEAMAAGADDFVNKNSSMADLRARVGVGKRTAEMLGHLLQQANRDGLTGLWNHCAIMDRMRLELSRPERDGACVGVIIGDVDHFKQINDVYGHEAGNDVLVEIARRMTAAAAECDVVGRYGGDEFLLVLPGYDTDSLCATAERIRQSVSAEPIQVREASLLVTMSLGVAVSRGGQSSDADLLAREADAALYRAKDTGRNRVESFCCISR